MHLPRPLPLVALFAAVALVVLVFSAPVAAAPLAVDNVAYARTDLQAAGALTPTLSLPLITQPPPPAATTINPIDNPLFTGVYQVSWQPVALASGYVAQESSDPGFSVITATGGGPGVLSWAANQGRAGTWYYRVKATAPWGESNWSPTVFTTAQAGIAGVVRSQGVPLSGIHLRLRFYDGSGFSTALETNTGADGVFRFTGAPTLAPGQSYYARYDNGTSGGNQANPAFLSYWGGANINSYQAGSSIRVDDMDVANVALSAPAPNAFVNLPAAFQWLTRQPAPGEGYWLELFKRDTSGDYYYTDPLGFVNTYIFTNLPAGFGLGTQYGWGVWVYDGRGGVGSSYYYRTVTFTGVEAVGVPGAEIERARNVGDRVETLKARTAAPGIWSRWPGH